MQHLLSVAWEFESKLLCIVVRLEKELCGTMPRLVALLVVEAHCASISSAVTTQSIAVLLQHMLCKNHGGFTCDLKVHITNHVLQLYFRS